MTHKISILGSGHGGIALAAHFSLIKHQVLLWSHKDHATKINGLIDGTGIEVTGCFEGFTHVYKATQDLCEAIDFAEYIFICLPANTHEKIFEEALPYFKSKQKIIIMPGNYSSLFLGDLIKKNQIKKEISVFETNNFPYACRADNFGHVEVLGIKNVLGIAALELQDTENYINEISQLLPNKLKKYQNVLHLGFEFTAGITHPVNALFNSARIDNQDLDFYFYKDGISQKTCKIIEKIDEERIEISKMYGFRSQNYLEIMREFYNFDFKNIYQFFKKSTTHNKERLVPTSLEHRYITQDIPFVLVPWYSLGKKKNFTAKTMENVINLFSIMNSENYFQSGRNFSNIELTNE